MEKQPAISKSQRKYKKRVLIVDDAPFYRVILGDLLRGDGHEVLTAEDGKEAIDVISEAEDPIDLLLLDINMPNKDGFQVLREMKDHGFYREGLPKVLVITGESFHRPEIKHARDLGANGFICKADPPEYTMTRIKKELF